MGFCMVLCWVAAVDTNQGVGKSLDQKCVAKMEPSNVGFVSYFDFVFSIYWYNLFGLFIIGIETSWF